MISVIPRGGHMVISLVLAVFINLDVAFADQQQVTASKLIQRNQALREGLKNERISEVQNNARAIIALIQLEGALKAVEPEEAKQTINNLMDAAAFCDKTERRAFGAFIVNSMDRMLTPYRCNIPEKEIWILRKRRLKVMDLFTTATQRPKQVFSKAFYSPPIYNDSSSCWLHPRKEVGEPAVFKYTIYTHSADFIDNGVEASEDATFEIDCPLKKLTINTKINPNSTEHRLCLEVKVFVHGEKTKEQTVRMGYFPTIQTKTVSVTGHDSDQNLLDICKFTYRCKNETKDHIYHLFLPH